MSDEKKGCCSVASQAEACSDSSSRPVEENTGCCSAKSKAPVSSCCGSDGPVSSDDASCCAPADKQRRDWIMWTCLPAVVLGYLGFLVIGHTEQYPDWFGSMLHTSYEMVNAMWWGILSAAFFVGILGRIPREAIMSVLGRGGSKRGIFRATLAGLLLDLCNHGILMVAMKLYERGASIGQVMAFLIASPWNSLTLTLILVGLIGLQWTLLFIAASLLIAWISGWIFDRLCDRGVLPGNPNTVEFDDIAFWPSVKASWKEHDWPPKALLQMFRGG